MVTGGFKVWHIIFIIIAFVVTIIVVYCCFHRCRIPRTKQEIEADLMRTNLTAKFRDYLQEFPNEPTTFLEALKKVQELEERWANEQDDTGAKKRMGWLKLRGKDRQADKGTGGAMDTSSDQLLGKEGEGPESGQTIEPSQQQPSTQDDKLDAAIKEPIVTTGSTNDEAKKKSQEASATMDTSKQLQPPSDSQAKPDKSSSHKEPSSKKPLGDLRSAKMAHVSDRATTADKERQQVKSEPASEGPTLASMAKGHKTKGEKVERQATKQKVDVEPAAASQVMVGMRSEQNVDTASAAPPLAASSVSTQNRPPKTKRKREKPNLSRTKAAHVGESIEANTNNILTIPVASHRHTHHHHHHQQHPNTEQQHQHGPTETATVKRHGRSHSSRTRVTRGDSTVIQINSDLTPTR